MQMPNIFAVKSCVSLFSFELSLHPDLSSERKLRVEKRLKSQGVRAEDQSHDRRWAGEERRQKGRSARGKRKKNKKNLVCNVIK